MGEPPEVDILEEGLTSELEANAPAEADQKVVQDQAELEATGQPPEVDIPQEIQAQKETPDPKEKRYDEGEGPFTFAEFEEYYGEAEARERWDVAFEEEAFEDGEDFE